jgi:phospholipid/cholesterol/gamma-HCH transport system permease protein
LIPDDKNRENYSGATRILSRLGGVFSNSYFGKLLTLFSQSIWVFLSPSGRQVLSKKQILWQIFFTGFEAIPLVFLVAMLFGTVIVQLVLNVMPAVGFGDLFGEVMVIVIVREFGPLLTAFLVAGRTGAGLATYIGNMTVYSEVDALRSLGIDPIRFLTMPAIIGGTISVLILSLFFNAIAIGAGFIFTQIAIHFFSLNVEIGWTIFRENIFNAMTVNDLIMMVIKPLAFGMIISTISCYQGLRLGNDVREVPQAASSTIVQSYVLIVITNVIISALFISQYLKTLPGLL